MKIALLQRYGSPNFVKIQDIEIPEPKSNDVQVEVYASSLNLTDVEKVRGDFVNKMSDGFRNPKNKRLGLDFSGRVSAIGKDVKNFIVGDEVCADLLYNKPSYGAFSEFICISENRLRFKPQSTTHVEASTIPQAGVLALQGIRGEQAPNSTHRILINGAGGGVGSFAVQIAKYYGANVTAVDNSEKLHFLESLGADHVIDYMKEDFSKQPEKYDLILDVIAKRSIRSYRRALKSGGQYFMLGGSFGQILKIISFGSIISKFSSKKTGIMMGQPNKLEDIEFLGDLHSKGLVKPVIDKLFSFDEIPEALHYLQDGKSKGKLVIEVKS